MTRPRAWLEAAVLCLAGTPLAWGQAPLTPEEEGKRGRADERIHLSGLPNYSWPWGELFYGRTYKTSLNVTNGCATNQKVRVDIGSGVADYLTMPETVDVPGWSTIGVEAVITTPEPPPPPVAAPGAASAFPWGIYKEVSGRVLIERFVGLANYDCFGGMRIYDVSGHIHYDPSPPDHDRDLGDPCVASWLSGKEPAGHGVDCTATFRTLARHHVEIVLRPFVAQAPAAWAWLPTAEQISSMGAEALLEVKERAERQKNAASAAARALRQ